MGVEPNSGITPIDGDPAVEDAPCTSDTTPYAISETAEISRSSLVEVSEIDKLIVQSNSRNCLEAIDSVCSWMGALLAQYSNPLPFRPGDEPGIDSACVQQHGDLVYLPCIEGGKVFVVSDIEGDFSIVERIFRDHRILERLERRDPNDQVFFVSLGDAIDRAGGEGSRIVDFLMHLKWDRGFTDNIHYVAGNHELSPNAQLDPNFGGFAREVIHKRASFQTPIDSSSDVAQLALKWLHDYFPDDVRGTSDTGYKLRVALWRLYNQFFGACPKHILTGNGILLCHAGITDKGPFAWVADPANHPKPSFEQAVRWLANAEVEGTNMAVDKRAQIADLRLASTADAVWSDFNPTISGTAPNTVRKDGLFFGAEALERYLEIFHVKEMLRGHQKMPPQGSTIFTPNLWRASNNLYTLNSVVGMTREYDDYALTTIQRQYVEFSLAAKGSLSKMKVYSL